MPKTIVLDIETAPLPGSELAPLMPEFSAPSTWKDPEKIKAAIETKRAEWLESCALDALTCRVLAIGLLVEGQFVLISEPATEAIMLHEFWDICAPSEGNHLVGFNCCQFDLPVLIRRSWKLGVAVPLGIRRGRYWGDNITDLRDVWQCGDRQAHGSLDTIAKHLGVGQKNGEGKDFARLWHNNRELALRYLQNDLALTAAIAKRMGVIE